MRHRDGLMPVRRDVGRRASERAPWWDAAVVAETLLMTMMNYYQTLISID